MNIRYKINIYERDVKYKIHSTENKLPKSLLVNNEKKKNKNLTIFEPKHHLGGCYGTDAMPLNQTATFLYQVSKGQSHMFGLYFFSTQYFQPKNKTIK